MAVTNQTVLLSITELCRSILSNPALEMPIMIAIAITVISVIYAVLVSFRKPLPVKKKVTRPPPIIIPDAAPIQVVVPEKKKTVGIIFATNTNFDMDEFTLRMYKSGFIADKVTDGIAKTRCIMINELCEFCMFRDMKSLLQASNNSILLKPYVKIALKDLTDCFQCNGELDKHLILKFKGRSIQFRMFCALDALYLVNGFQAIISRLKYDKHYLEIHHSALINEPSKYSHNARLRSMCINNAVMTHHFPGQGTVGDEDEGGSIMTASTRQTSKNGARTPQK